jgi:hypothetical protein
MNQFQRPFLEVHLLLVFWAWYLGHCCEQQLW